MKYRILLSQKGSGRRHHQLAWKASKPQIYILKIEEHITNIKSAQRKEMAENGEWSSKCVAFHFRARQAPVSLMNYSVNFHFAAIKTIRASHITIWWKMFEECKTFYLLVSGDQTTKAKKNKSSKKYFQSFCVHVLFAFLFPPFNCYQIDIQVVKQQENEESLKVSNQAKC